jgi:competence protein ComEC
MVKSSNFFPLSFTASGAACLYYVLPYFLKRGLRWAEPLLVIALALAVLLCLFRVLGTFPRLDEKTRRRFRMLVIYLTALETGLFLGTGARIAASTEVRLGMAEGQVTGVAGRLIEDPRLVAGGRGMGTLELEYVRGKGGLRTSAQGAMPVFFPDDALKRLKSFGRGSRIYIEGNLAPGREGEGPLFRARAVHITTPAGALERFRTALRLKLTEQFSRHKWGGLSLALLLGIRDNLDTNLALSYKNAGCAHVLALSGMHLAIVSSVLAFFLKKPLGLRAAAIVGAVFIIAYVYLVGVQPSLARSAIMYLLGALALLGAFPKKAPLLLALAFLIQIVIWPVSGDSLSFILSYLALAGILFIGEGVHSLLRGPVPEILSQPLSASLGAFAATSPVTAAFFGIIQAAGIFAGLVIVPLTTLFMLISMAEPLLSLIPPLGKAADTVLSLLYLFLDRLVGIAARLPPLRVQAVLPALIFAVTAAVIVYLFNNRLTERRSRLDPFG